MLLLYIARFTLISYYLAMYDSIASSYFCKAVKHCLNTVFNGFAKKL